MPLNIRHLRELTFEPIETIITDRDVMLYALSIGVGRDPLDAHDLRYVYERDLRVFPTMALIVGHPGNWMADPGTGITRTMVMHGAQRLWCHAELPIGRAVVTTNRIAGILDKGEKGAVLVLERETRDGEHGALIARSASSIFCRADGGFDGPSGPTYEFDLVPERDPDQSVDIPTQRNAALLYRLNQDRNPLHADPEAARLAGFPRPILHGLCTFGLAAGAITKAFPDLILDSIETRFSKPVLPGETITLDLWRLNGVVAFRARIAARAAIVLDRGRVTFAAHE